MLHLWVSTQRIGGVEVHRPIRKGPSASAAAASGTTSLWKYSCVIFGSFKFRTHVCPLPLWRGRTRNWWRMRAQTRWAGRSVQQIGLYTFSLVPQELARTLHCYKRGKPVKGNSIKNSFAHTLQRGKLSRTAGQDPARLCLTVKPRSDIDTHVSESDIIPKVTPAWVPSWVESQADVFLTLHLFISSCFDLWICRALYLFGLIC